MTITPLAAEYGFDFDEILDRRASDSVKWNADWIAADMLSMFLADQDFRSAPAIIEALRARCPGNFWLRAARPRAQTGHC